MGIDKLTTQIERKTRMGISTLPPPFPKTKKHAHYLIIRLSGVRVPVGPPFFLSFHALMIWSDGL